ncbi:UNVERIFIED_CONTAM: Potassium transporter 7 [Sesamum angustifolium]|uniref:Potassium transporter 7 n=1 Tax=Sesamum angustifolium TaxID=2727405 RepID=A0AAW2QBG8_9LAMI
MTEEGSERENGGLGSMDSIESRWVYQDEEGSEIDNDDQRGVGGNESPQRDSEDEDNAEQRLIRTGPPIDSFDVEALEVPGAQRSDFEDISLGRRIITTFQTLGVVFGDVGTSPYIPLA